MRGLQLDGCYLLIFNHCPVAENHHQRVMAETKLRSGIQHLLGRLPSERRQFRVRQ